MQTSSLARQHRRIQGLLLALALPQGAVGVWAILGPRSFYDRFPAPGHPWVASLGPFNEHLIVDYGATSLALVAISLMAVRTPGRAITVAAAIGWTAWTFPHLLFHLAHGDALAPLDSVLNVAVVVVNAALAVLLFIAARVLPDGADPVVDGDLASELRSGPSGKVSSR